MLFFGFSVGMPCPPLSCNFSIEVAMKFLFRIKKKKKKKVEKAQTNLTCTSFTWSSYVLANAFECSFPSQKLFAKWSLLEEMMSFLILVCFWILASLKVFSFFGCWSILMHISCYYTIAEYASRKFINFMKLFSSNLLINLKYDDAIIWNWRDW